MSGPQPALGAEEPLRNHWEVALVENDRWPGCKVVEACHSETDHGALQIIHSQQPKPEAGACLSGPAKVWVSVLIDSSGIHPSNPRWPSRKRRLFQRVP